MEHSFKSELSLKNGIRIAVCRECGNPVIKITSLRAYDITYICKCGCMGKMENLPRSLPDKRGLVAYKIGNEIICPECRRVLLEIRSDKMFNFAFKAECECGRIYSRYREQTEAVRNIGVFASKEK